MSRRPQLPSSLDGSLTPFLSRGRLREQAAIVDDMLGGVERLHHEANRTPETYRWFKDYQARLEPREVQQEHSLSTGMEALLKRVEERKKERQASVVDAKFTVVEAPRAAEEQPDEGS
jgi:hypothetical protein